MLKKTNLIGLSFILLHSCSVDTSKIAPGYAEAFRTLKNTIIPQKNELITPEVIEKIPYASMTLRIGRGAPGLMILESFTDERETWVSADGVYLVIEKGQIIKTAGLHNNLVNFRAVDNDFKDLIQSKDSEKLYFYYSYDEPELNNMRVEAKRKFIKTERTELLGSTKDLNIIEERISNNFIGWKETNMYWVDSDGFVWKSKQHVSPKLPRFEIEVTKRLSQ
jgi:hypothetical protein